jgi:hypothetical protein
LIVFYRHRASIRLSQPLLQHMKTYFSPRLIRTILAYMLLLTGAYNKLQAQTFSGEGNWKTPELWDTGVVPGDGAAVIINGVAEISENLGADNADNPGRITIGLETEGTLNVTGGTLSGANGGGAGIFVGAGVGGIGRVNILPGTGLRSQGGNMVMQVGDEDGGIGFVSVGGELLNYKFFRIVNGTLEMLPTGINNRFNQLDNISTIETDGTLSFVIDGDQVGSLERANANGLNVDIFPGANLKITLEGDFAVNDSWMLMRYHTLIGSFDQGTSFTNEQGYTFEIDYGIGEDDDVTLTLTSTANRPSINAFSANPPGIAAGDETTLSWDVGAFTILNIEPNVGNVTSMTSNGNGSIAVSPTVTTTYLLTLTNNDATITASTTVVVDEAPIIELLTASPMTIVPGSSSTLEWKVAGADSITIEPTLGSVDASGTATVSPAETTTYTLTAINRNGTTTLDSIVTVDAIQAALLQNYDAAAPKQASGAIFDVISGASFDLKTALLDTGISSFTTTLTAAYHLTTFGGNSGGDGNSLPGGNVSYEAWVRAGDLGAEPQVIFETGGNADGASLLISEGSIQFLNSQNGERTHELEVPLGDISLTDFIQIVATMNQSSGDVQLFVQSSSGGSGMAMANGELGLPNGRASLFNWTNFGAGVAGALGGIGSEVPAGATLFRGELALLNVYDRPLTEEEVETAFNRIAIPDPGLINNFSATPDRAASGDSITLNWIVGEVQSLTLLGPGGGDVSALTANGEGSLDVQLTQSTRYSLVAEGVNGASTSSLMILIDVAPDVVILNQSADSWDNVDAWADGQAPRSGQDYLVTDFVASSLSAPADPQVSFGGDSLEILGEGAQLRFNNNTTDSVDIDDLRLSGGSIVFTGNEGSLTLDGGLTIRQDSEIDITGTFNSLILDSAISGPGEFRVTAATTSLEEDETLVINGNNSEFSGGWTFVGGRTFADGSGSMGSGDLELINANLEINTPVNSPEARLILQGTSTLALFEDSTFNSMNFRLADGTATTIPAGTYTFNSWIDIAEDLGLDSFQLDLVGNTSLTVLEENPLPTQGSVFTGEGEWFTTENWSEGVPTDGSNAIVNGTAEINRDIGTSNADNPSRLFVGDQATGVLNVTGGTLSGAHTGANAGVFVGLGSEGNGTINISEGAALRSQGGGMVVQIGDASGGIGRMSVAGQLFNYKFFQIVNGTLEMLPTGVNNSFNEGNVSSIGANGVLAYVIDGEMVGGLLRANDNGLPLEINPSANLKITLNGSVSEGQSWVLIDYSSLTGTFAQGTQFTNEQGHVFGIDYGSGALDVVTLTLTTINPDAAPPTVSLTRADGTIQIEFTGTLESSPEVEGPYTAVAGAVSPMTIETDAPHRFYRAAR